MVDFTTVKRIFVPAFYTCDGTEQGICETTFDGNLYKIYINYARAGAVIMYMAGHFYAVSGTVDIAQPDYQVTEKDTTPAPNKPKEITLEGDNPEDKTVVVFDTPEVEIEPGTSIEYNVQKTDDVVTVTYRKSGTVDWIEIPVLTDEDVLRIEGGIKVISANIETSGTTLRLT